MYLLNLHMALMSKSCARVKGIGKYTFFFSDRYTFVDLAQIVCKVPDPVPENQSSTDDEGFGGYVSEPSSTARVS